MPPLPLKGILVLDLTTVRAGPFASVLQGERGVGLERVAPLQHVDVNTRRPAAVPAAAAQSPAGTLSPNRAPGERLWGRMDPTRATPVTRKCVGISPHAGPIFKLSRAPQRTSRPAPTLGEQNASVSCGLLGVTGAERAALERDGHTGERYVEA